MNAKTSYVTVSEADTYFQGVLNKQAWTRASFDDQQTALIEASTRLDNLEYIGTKSENTQEHEFPRLYADQEFDRNLLDTDSVPFGIKYATCELALALLDGFSPEMEIDALSMVQHQYGQVKTNYDRDWVPMHLKAGLPATAWHFILPFVRDVRQTIVSRV